MPLGSISIFKLRVSHKLRATAVVACFKMKLRHLCFAVVLSSIAVSCCRGQGGGGGAGGAVVPGTQDAIQIVAQAALCFDNRQVINGCLQSMGINMTSNGSGNGATSTAGTPALAPALGPSAAGSGTNNGSIMCQRPCFGQMMLMMTCVNGILGNIQGYSPGLMQGVQAIFQMSCGNVGNGQGGGGAGGGAAGGGAGGSGGGGAGGGSGTGSAVVAAGSHVAVSNLGEQTSSAAGPAASLKSGFPSMLVIWNCIWLLPVMYVAL